MVTWKFHVHTVSWHAFLLKKHMAPMITMMMMMMMMMMLTMMMLTVMMLTMVVVVVVVVMILTRLHGKDSRRILNMGNVFCLV